MQEDETIPARHGLRAIAVSVLGLLVACSGGDDTQRARGPTLEPWPFTVDQVDLSCEPGRRVFVTAPDGRRFAVNGTARAEAPFMSDIQATIQINHVIQRGLALCDDARRSMRFYAPRRAAESPLPPEPSFRIEPAQLLPGIFAIATAETMIDRRRPELTFSCERGQAPMVWFDVVRAPRTPPPLRGVFATLETSSGERFRVELFWMRHAQWGLRSGDERVLDQRMTRAALASEFVTLRSEDQYLPTEPITWRVAGFGSRLAELRRTCRR